MTVPTVPPGGAPAGHHVTFTELDLGTGEHAGCARTGDGLTISLPQGGYAYAGTEYEYATWIAEPSAVPSGFTELIASWAADTPPGTWIEVCVRTRRTGTRAFSHWFVLARWDAHGAEVVPTSVPHQSDPLGRIEVETFLAAPEVVCDSWQLRVTLLRRAGLEATPSLRYAAAMVSTAAPTEPGSSAPGPQAGRLLELPADAEGPAVAQVLRYWGTGPADDPAADAERRCADHAAPDLGNRSFDVAYAAGFGLRAAVTRLRDLTEAERLLAAGIPVIIAVPEAPRAPKLRLLVLTGCTVDGEVVIADPASAEGRVFPREQVEPAWLAGSGGLVYLIHPPSADPNW